MKRQLLKTRFDDEKIRVRLTMETEPCTREGPESRYIKFELLRYIAEDPAVSACGHSDFETMKMYHDGFKWIVECEAVVPKAQA